MSGAETATATAATEGMYGGATEGTLVHKLQAKLDRVRAGSEKVLEQWPTIDKAFAKGYEKTKVRKGWLLMAAVVLLVLLVGAVGGYKLLINLVGFVYPAYASFAAIKTEDKEDDTQVSNTLQTHTHTHKHTRT